MATLEENLQEIKNQKDTFIKPENLKEGITCFGITGTLTGNTTTKIYDTVETMQADTTQADGTICIVGIRDVDKSETNRPDINIFELPENIPASDVTTGTLITFGNGTFGITDTNIYIEAMENMVTDQYTLYTKTGDNYIRESGLGLLNAITDITGGRNTGYYAEFQMLDNKVKFISNSLPRIEEQLAGLQEELRQLLLKEDYFTQKVVKSNTYEDLEKLINELNTKFQEKGEYENIIHQIESIEEEISNSEKELQEIDEKLFSETFKSHVQEQVDKFNIIFSQISRLIYDEEYVIKFDSVINKRTKTNIYKFTSFNANLSTGKKMGEISCFDIAYTMFARQENIPCLYFLLNDKKELIHVHQLIKVADLYSR